MKGLKTARKWWTTWGTLPVLSWVKAAALYKEGRFEEAYRYYQRGLARHTKHPARYCARMDLAYCLFRMRRLEEAEGQLRHVLERLPHSREAAVRLAQVYAWTGNAVKAAWTLRDAVRQAPADEDLIARFVLAVLEHGVPAHLLQEAVSALLSLDKKQMMHPKVEIARAALAVHKGQAEKGRAVLAALAMQAGAPIEAHLCFANVLLEEGKVSEARLHLNRGMLLEPENPRVLTLLARSYLIPGRNYAPDFACQLATKACQNSAWLNPSDIHALAQAYYHAGDRMSALLAASKAKEVGKKRLVIFRDEENIEQLIASLSTGTLA